MPCQGSRPATISVGLIFIAESETDIFSVDFESSERTGVGHAEDRRGIVPQYQAAHCPSP
jgi:hypothetical protein